MKLLFLVGCAEPGHDGVGDYTSILAEQCRQQGHECRIASLYDSYVLDQPEISTLKWRFPNALQNKNEQHTLRELCEEFSPDWISLQFVPYAFHPKGISWGLGRLLESLAKKARLHIMFHETWTGPHLHASLKNKTYGLLQRFTLKYLLKKRAPNSTHTHAAPYLYLLEKLGLHPKQLLLPSNIPLSPNDENAWLWNELNKQGISINENTRENYLLLGIFGSIYPEWPAKAFCSKIKELAKAQKKKCILISIGHIGGGASSWNKMAKESDSELAIVSLGGLDEERISKTLQSLDVGVAALPWSLIEKGSSVSTLLAHGLPVIVPRDDIHFGFSFPEPGNTHLIKMALPTQEIISRIKKSAPNDPVESITKQFLSDLNRQ